MTPDLKGMTFRAKRRVAVVMALLFLSACASTLPPVVNPIVARLEVRPTVVFVTGLTGTTLIDRATGRIVWGDFTRFFLPRDLGYATAVPIGGATSAVAAGEPIVEVKAGPLYRREVYRPVVTTLEANGYRRGEDFILFGYDWRQSNVDSARELARLLDGLDARGPVVLVCQSNGGYLCRWAVRFGDVGLDDVEKGTIRRPRVRVAALVMLGTTHVGSIRILREIDRGRTYVTFGRFLSPEAFFTYQSLYQDLPSMRDDAFVDEQGRLIEVELFDASTWVRYGWSIFGRDAKERANEREDLFGKLRDRIAFLQRSLDDARRFHSVLRDGPPPPEGTSYYSIQNRTHRTIDRAMLVERNGTWETLFIGDPEIDSRPDLEPVMATLGDVHAGIEGQESLPAAERERLAEPVIAVDGDHLGIIRSRAAHEAILKIICELSSVERQRPDVE